MFESQSKKEPKLVFSHKSQQNSTKSSGNEGTQIPRVALSVGGSAAGLQSQTLGGQNRSDVLNVGGSQQTQQYKMQERPLLEKQALQRQGVTLVQQESKLDEGVVKTSHVLANEKLSSNLNTLQVSDRKQVSDLQFQTLELKKDPESDRLIHTSNTEVKFIAKNNDPPIGHSHVHNYNVYKDVAYAEKAVAKPVSDDKNSSNTAKIEQFEGYSIYRGAREMTIGQIQTPETPKASTGSQLKATEVRPGETISMQKTDNEASLLRHPDKGVRAASAINSQQFKTLPNHSSLQYQKVQTIPHQIVYSEQGNQLREFRLVPLQQNRVQSYPQASGHGVAKALRLVPVNSDSGYAHTKVRMAAPTGKQRPQSYTAPPRYAVPVTWQTTVPGGYVTMQPDGNLFVVKPRSSSVSSRQSYRVEPDTPLSKQTTPSNNVRPKSILKNQAQPEVAPEWHQNARPIHIPRPQSIANPSAKTDQNYDFSAILKTNSDLVSYAKHKNDELPDPSSRTEDADAVSLRSEASQQSAPQKKSVKFNSQVRLHTEDHVSNVVTLSVPT
nr:hypothetical protein BgiMline_019250 [Biomphalaria glabrata]